VAIAQLPPAPASHANLTPASKKYRTITVSYTKTNNSGGGFTVALGVEQFTYNASNSVDKWGKMTRTASGRETLKLIPADGGSPTTLSDDPAAKPEDLDAMLAYLSKCAFTGTTHLNAGCGPFGSEGDLTIGRSGDNILTLHFEPNPTTTGYRLLFDCPGVGATYIWSANPDDRACGDDTAGSVVETVKLGTIWDLTLTLSDAYTYANVLDDITAALATWDLSNHHLYPPRTDTITNGGPLLTYNERVEIEVTATFIQPDDSPLLDTSLPRYPDQAEGAIIGRPLPIGAGPHYDFYHLQWDLDDERYGIGNPRNFGQWSNASPFNIPHATQWTDELHHLVLPQAPFIFCDSKTLVGARFLFPKLNENDDTQLRVPTGSSALLFFQSVMVATHAQIKIAAPNHNYNRPCAGDRDELDLADVATKCDHDNPREDAAKRWPTAPEDCDHDNPYWNDPWPKGYFLAKTWDYNFRDWLESYRCILQAEARRIDNLARADADDPCSPACPELTPPAAVRFNPLLVDVIGCIGADDRQITTLNTGQIMYDGDATIGGSKWLSAQNTTQYCIESKPCNPGIIYIQPAGLNAGIHDTQAVKIDMPYFSGGSVLDSYYGTLWIARIEQVMTDPLWKAPGKNYEQLICDGVSLREDDGQCRPDCVTEFCLPQYKYYPQRPYEEAEATQPGGSPALPTGSRTLGCPDYVAHLNLSTPIVNRQDAAPAVPECASPYHYFIEFVIADIENPCRGGYYQLMAGSNGNGSLGVGYPVQASPFVPWRWALDRQACADRSGRFAKQYKQ
jgi:hypothetical protein